MDDIEPAPKAAISEDEKSIASTSRSLRVKTPSQSTSAKEKPVTMPMLAWPWGDDIQTTVQFIGLRDPIAASRVHKLYPKPRLPTVEKLRADLKPSNEIQNHSNGTKPSKKKDQPIKNMKCLLCSKVFSKEKNLLFHMQAHQGSLERLLCPYCNYSFLRISDFHTHAKTEHSNMYNVEPSTNLPTTLVLNGSASTSSLKSESDSKSRVLIISTPSRPPTTGQPVEKPKFLQYPTHSQVLSKAPMNARMSPQIPGFRPVQLRPGYPCVTCKKVFKTNATLMEHGMKDHNGIPCTYPDCAMVFVQENNLKYHLENEHPVNKCAHCSISFKTAEILEEHVKNWHRNVTQNGV